VGLSFLSSKKLLALQHPTNTTDWRIASIISNILYIRPPTASWQASHVNRSANFYIHHVANWAATRIYSDWIPIISPLSSSFPPCFRKVTTPLSLFHKLAFFFLQCTHKKKTNNDVMISFSNYFLYITTWKPFTKVMTINLALNFYICTTTIIIYIKWLLCD
jgi:hypothetical protein